MTGAILYQERLSFMTRGPALIAIGLIAATLLYAGFSGDQWRDARLASLDAFEAQQTESLAEWREQLAGIEAGTIEPSPFDANPMSISFPAVLPPSALGDFAIGHADLHPASAAISPWRHLSSVFGRYQFDNPTTLASSRFDVALVVVLLMPILMIAVSFDVLAADRSRGSLSMLMSFPVRLPRLAWTRLLFRNGILWGTAVAAMALLLIVNDPGGGDRYARFGLWIAVCLAYAAFWTTLIAFCIASFRTATNAAAALIAVWMLITLAIPATVTTVSEAAYPTPSRLAFLSEIRLAQGETNRELAEVTKGFLLDHPELSVGDESLPSYFRAAFLSNEAARANTRPILDAYEAARAGRARTLGWAQYLSPSIIAQRLLNIAAGADLDRQHRFQAQTQDALQALAAAVGPAIVSRNRLSVEDFDTLSPFRFEEPRIGAVASAALPPMAFLVLLSVLFGVLAQKKLASSRLHE